MGRTQVECSSSVEMSKHCGTLLSLCPLGSQQNYQSPNTLQWPWSLENYIHVLDALAAITAERTLAMNKSVSCLFVV